jgi:hypothetical protein
VEKVGILAAEGLGTPLPTGGGCTSGVSSSWELTPFCFCGVSSPRVSDGCRGLLAG